MVGVNDIDKNISVMIGICLRKDSDCQAIERVRNCVIERYFRSALVMVVVVG